MDAERCYADYQAMFAAEAQRPDGIRAVSVATPNGTHFAISKAALEAGLHVVCEKPLCFTTAEELRALASAHQKIVGVTYGYAGHQLIEQAREMIAAGELGDIGTPPLHLSEVMLPPLKIKRLMCSRQSFVKRRAPLADKAFTIMEYDSGAVGHVWSCAVNAGSMHGQKVRVIGSQASIEGGTSGPTR